MQFCIVRVEKICFLRQWPRVTRVLSRTTRSLMKYSIKLAPRFGEFGGKMYSMLMNAMDIFGKKNLFYYDSFMIRTKTMTLEIWGSIIVQMLSTKHIQTINLDKYVNETFILSDHKKCHIISTWRYSSNWSVSQLRDCITMKKSAPTLHFPAYVGVMKKIGAEKFWDLEKT